MSSHDLMIVIIFVGVLYFLGSLGCGSGHHDH